MPRTRFSQKKSPLAEEIGWDSIPVVHIPSLVDVDEPWYGYKFVSLIEAFSWIKAEGDWAQFGVYKGTTARLLASVLPKNRNLHLYDSFDGLPEDWITPRWEKGSFSLSDSQIPSFESKNVIMHRGLFKDRIPETIQCMNSPFAFMHIDSDLYSSAIDILFGANKAIAKGTVILFDEFFMATRDGDVRDDECRALIEWGETFERKWSIVWRTNWVQACVLVEQ